MQNSPRSATLKDHPLSKAKEEWPNHTRGYKIVSGVGKGYFGVVTKSEVLEGRHKGQFVAVKKLDLEKCGSTKIEEIRKNTLLLNLLDHPNILSYKTSFIHNKDLWIISELMQGGSVEKIMQKTHPNGIKDQALIATIIKETLQGLKYLHQNNQIHRNVRASNILIGSDGSVKISDFGMCTKLKEGKKRNSFIGSPCWMAPEVLEQDQKSGYDLKIDIWSLGITALEIAQGRPPNSDLTTMKLILKTLNDEPPILTEESCWDENFREFISHCLVKDPTKRKSAEELLKCCKNFFSKAKGKEYIKEKLLKDVGSWEFPVDKNGYQVGQTDGSEKKSSRCSGLDSFCFQVEDTEQEQSDKRISELVDNCQLEISKTPLSRIDTGLLIRRSFSTCADGDKAKEPQSASSKLGSNLFDKQDDAEKVFSRFAVKRKSEKVIICKGDLANFNLPEEEI
jgi:serine/threonine-protein kinase OSR1/STK39